MPMFAEEDEFFKDLLEKFKQMEQINYYEQTFLVSLYFVGAVRRNDLRILFRKFLNDQKYLVHRDFANLEHDMFGFAPDTIDVPEWADEDDDSED